MSNEQAPAKRVRRAIPVGTEFFIYGWAAGGAVLITSRTRRIKTNDGRGSKRIATEWLGTTFPATLAGANAADAWALRMNTAEGDRVGVEVPE